MSKNEKYLIDLIKEINIKDSIPMTMHEMEVITEDEGKLDEIDGFIEVRDHEIFVIDAKEGGKQPILLPNINLHITINGQVLTRERVVFEHDKIHVQNNITSPAYAVQVSKDHLSVFLQVYPELFQKYQLKNKKRANQLMLEMETVPAECDVEEYSSQIVEEVMKKGIRVEVNTTLIMQELMNPTFKPILVAEGLPFIPAVDAQLESFIVQNITEIMEEVDGKVDFKNRLKIPTVKAGQVIAQLHPPKEGKDGINIFGDILHPKPPKKLEVRVKPRVRLNDDGTVIALQSGRPSITGRTVKHIDILDTYIVEGDVCMKTGNIYFNGDVIVRGNVRDNMSVECSGSLFVYGNVYNARLTATQHIYIFGTVINSKVIAGQLSVFYSSIYKLSQDLSITIVKLQEALDQLKSSLQAKGLAFDFGHVLTTLIDAKFSRIIQNANDIFTIIQEMPNQAKVSAKFRILLNSLLKFKHPHTIRTVHSEAELHSILFSVKDVITEMESMITDASQVQIDSANMATIKTNGDIVVKKEGVINSNLFAGGNIFFDLLDSVTRGGKLEALKSIRAGVVGTQLGVPPELYAGESISIMKIFQVVIKFPNYYTFIDEETTNFVLKYDSKSEEVINLSK